MIRGMQCAILHDGDGGKCAKAYSIACRLGASAGTANLRAAFEDQRVPAKKPATAAAISSKMNACILLQNTQPAAAPNARR